MEALDKFILPVLGAVLAGGLIGFEREYRGRPAGFRTHILVSLASALLMLAAVHQMEWMENAADEIIRIDPVRMAHGILTGIGFLCGGVIFRQGLSVPGLPTAASLWITSALGTLTGVGLCSSVFFGDYCCTHCEGGAHHGAFLCGRRWLAGLGRRCVPRSGLITIAGLVRRPDLEVQFSAVRLGDRGFQRVA